MSVLRGRRTVRHSSFPLGRYGMVINIATLVWITLAIVIFCMPVSLPVTASDMNYASVVFAGFASISMLWYFVHGRKAFTGPPVPQDANPDEAFVDGQNFGQDSGSKNPMCDGDANQVQDFIGKGVEVGLKSKEY